MTAGEHRASCEQCQNNYSFLYMCCRYCLYATCQYCAMTHRHCFVHRFSETNPPIRVWSTGKLNRYVQLAEDVDRCWCVSGGGRTELARLDPCLCTVSGFLGPPQTSVSEAYDRSEVTLIFGHQILTGFLMAFQGDLKWERRERYQD